MFCIETEKKHETFLVLDPHVISPLPALEISGTDRTANQDQPQLRTPNGSPAIATHEGEDSIEFRDTTEVNPPQVSIGDCQNKRGKLSSVAR